MDGARLIGRGMVNSIANIQELTVVGRGNDFSANSYLLAAILHRYGWLAALAAAAVPLGFIGAAFWRVFRLRNLLGRMLAGAVCMFFTTQALVYCAVNFGLPAVCRFPCPSSQAANWRLRQISLWRED